MFIFFAALNVRLAFTAHRIYILGTCHVHDVCTFVFNEQYPHLNRQASKDEIFSETGRGINKDIVAPNDFHRFPLFGKIVR